MSRYIRKASVMMLKAGCEQEYQHRHDELWPEMEQALKQHGAHNYSIFLHPQSLQLFAYVEIESESLWQQIAETDVCQRWWHYMQDIMHTNADCSPQSVDLSAMFYLS